MQFKPGPNVVSSSKKQSSTEIECTPVNSSNPANVPQKNASYAEAQLPLVAHQHNHSYIVNFVGTGKRAGFAVRHTKFYHCKSL